MNSPLEQDFNGFEHTQSNNNENVPESGLPILEEEIDLKPIECMQTTDSPQCGVCGEKFLTKNELRTHITEHLGQPRIILKRCNNLQLIKTKDTYGFKIQEKKGSLKLTLKKQNHSDFAVINRELDFDHCNRDDYCLEEEAADCNSSNECLSIEKESEEQEIEQSQFDDAIVNDSRSSCPDDNYSNNEDDEDDNNNEEGGEDEDDENDDGGDDEDEIDENYRPSGEPNEGDSGVGSDMANPLEKEDLTIDDYHNSADHYESEDVDKNIDDNDNEDPEESDELEATCRETIENLKKLGEESSSRSLREDIPSRDNEKTSNNSSPIDSPVLDQDTALQIFSKNLALEVQTPEKISERIRKNGNTTIESNSNVNWSEFQNNESNNDTRDNDDLIRKNNHQRCDNTTEDNTEANNTILREFLNAQQQKVNRDKVSRVSPIETEYVSLERLAETVSMCRICNEKFHDITQLEDHKSKAGHYHCNIPDCSNLVFTTMMEVSIHKSQAHGAPLSPTISIVPTNVGRSSPHKSNESSSRVKQNNSPHLPNHSSPHNMTIDSGTNHQPVNRTSSSIKSSQRTYSPPFNVNSHPHQSHQQQQQMVPPVNFEQLSAPVQQLAQQVQRMALPPPPPPPPQSQMPPTLPPGINTMIPTANYFSQPPGRPPLYRMPGPQSMQYPVHIAHLYSQYNASPYASQYPSQLHQQIPRGRYPQIVSNTRAPRIPGLPQPRQRVKRPLTSTATNQPRTTVESAPKQRRMDLLLPDRNEDADCHVIAQQKRNDGLPVIQNVQGATSQQQNNRSDSTIHLTDSITLSVRQSGSTSSAQVQNSTGNAKKTDAKAVANVLAARGITVTPAAAKNKLVEPQKQQQQQTPQVLQQQQQQQQQPQPQQQQQRAAPAVDVAALNLNSAISIIPANSQRKQQQQQQPQQSDQSFAVPQSKQNKQGASSQEVERPPRPPTVDLTQDVPLPPPYPTRRGRPTRFMLTCQICDKNFPSQEVLGQHMTTHRGTNKLHHKCNLCPAQYPTAQDLSLHKQTYHKEHETMSASNGTELAIPVIDLKSPQTLNRLSSLGIQSYIPLSQLSAQTGGYFGLPIITIDGPRNPNTCNLGALGATSILSLGPLRSLSNR